MKKFFQTVVLILTITACGKDGGVTPNPHDRDPVVKIESTYEVIFEEDVTYGEGLSHESLNSANHSTISLKLDIYVPNNDLEHRPLFMFIHGGGFSGGTKQQERIIDWANYYASRGWVFLSIDYRVKKDLGTVPQEWADVSSNLPNAKVRQFLAIYPAIRDAKTAMRWIVANAEAYKINTDYITVGGGSAGAITAITLGISNQEDFRDEISVSQDPTLANANLEQTFQIKTIVDLWGSKIALDAFEGIYGHKRFDSNDPPLFIAHGTEDNTVPFSSAEDLKTKYETNQLPFVYYPLQNKGHGAWNAQVDNKRLEELAFDFIVDQQSLIVE